jgi:hypothetical protein
MNTIGCNSPKGVDIYCIPPITKVDENTNTIIFCYNNIRFYIEAKLYYMNKHATIMGTESVKTKYTITNNIFLFGNSRIILDDNKIDEIHLFNNSTMKIIYKKPIKGRIYHDIIYSLLLYNNHNHNQ